MLKEPNFEKKERGYIWAESAVPSFSNEKKRN